MAIRKAVPNNVVARAFLNLRLRLMGWNVGPLTGASSVACVILRSPSSPAARASALTMNVKMNKTKPAAM